VIKNYKKMLVARKPLEIFIDNKILEYQKKFDALTDIGDANALCDLITSAKSELNNYMGLSKASLLYSIGTAICEFQRLTNLSEEKHLEEQFYYYRLCEGELEQLLESSIKETKNKDLLKWIYNLKLLLYTNLGNSFNIIGRKIMAIDSYRKVLIIFPEFGNAQGNCGASFFEYAQLIEINWISQIFHYEAYDLLSKAVKNKNTDFGAKNFFESYIRKYDVNFIEGFLKKDLQLKEKKFSSKKETFYRKWCLNNRLFLNTLNDVQNLYDAFSEDSLHLPSMVVAIENQYALHGLFNQLKQEYIFARFLLYEGYNDSKLHYADKHNFLYQTYDYPLYSIRIEKIKTAYRLLYSIFDKSAFFLNKYFDLGIKEKDVSINSIWYKEKKGKNGYAYKNILPYEKNYALNGLRWICKDMFKDMNTLITPKIEKMRSLRNQLEHKYLKVFIDNLKREEERDGLAEYMAETELMSLTLELCTIIRELLINLTLCVRIEEIKKDKPPIEINFITYDDEWKF